MSGKTKLPQREAVTETPKSGYQNNYEDTYGSTLGGKIWEQVEDNANPDKLDGYLGDLVDGGTSSLADLLSEHAGDEDKELAGQTGLHLQDQVGGDLKNWLSDTDLSESVFNWAGENPVGTGLLGVGAAAAYIASDPDIDGDFDFNLTDNTELSLGGDAGSLFDLGLHEVRGGVTHTDGNQKYGMNGAHSFDQNRSSLSAFYNTHNANGTSFGADASFTHQGDRNTAGANSKYLTPEMGMQGGATWDSNHPEFGEYGKLQGSMFSRGDGPSKWNLGGSMDTEGAYRMNGGYHWANDDTSFGIEGHHGRDAMGQDDTGIMATFKHSF